MRWRELRLDVPLGVAGSGLDLMVSACDTEDSVSLLRLAGMALLVGAPMALVRHRPVPVTLVLAAVAVLTDQMGSFSANTAQIMLCLATGVVAYTHGWRVTLAVLPVTAAATAVNLADPGLALTATAWFFTVAISLLPCLIGLYLRRPALRGVHLDLTADLMLAGAGLAISVLSTWSDWKSGFEPIWVSGLFVVLGGAVLGLARRLPGLVFLLEAAMLVVGDRYFPAVSGTFMILMGISVAVFAMRVGSWGWTIVVYLVSSAVAASRFVNAVADITPVRVLTLVSLTVVPVAIGRYLGARQAAAEAERLRAAESVRLAAAQLRADRLAERERLAREVHDIVAHHVGAMVLRAGAARYAAPEGPAAEALADIRETGHQVLEDLRGLLEVLRDPEAEPELLADPADVLRESAERMSAAGLHVELDLDPEASQAPLVTRASAARIVQEGLTNVLKHAGPGTTVHVRVAGAAGGGLDIEIANTRPPAPGPVLPSSGQGLTGMRERARALGGSLSAGPDGEGGWRLTALLPAGRS
ncbi:histidine kinase [Nonomuraea sp. NPDC050310]|uniref:sensor histidine kinase n=1 Tax=unclassified Nonomuraea TaxID=2593643 RepID=UPI00340A9663